MSMGSRCCVLASLEEEEDDEDNDDEDGKGKDTENVPSSFTATSSPSDVAASPQSLRVGMVPQAQSKQVLNPSNATTLVWVGVRWASFLSSSLLPFSSPESCCCPSCKVFWGGPSPASLSPLLQGVNGGELQVP